MATRIYPTNTAAGISPAWASGWEDTAGGVKKAASLSTADYESGSGVIPNGAGTGTGSQDSAHGMIVWGPLAAATITGTFKGQILAREANAATDARAQVTVRVLAPDASTVRGTLIAMDTAANSSEFAVDTAQRENRKFPRGGAASVTSTDVTDGDYIVIEWGHRNHGTNTGVVAIRGCTAATVTSDAPEDETTTVANDTGIYRMWFEFSQTISPLTAPVGTVAAATGAALNAKTTIAPTLTAPAAAVGAAYNATVSYLVPPRTVLIDGADYTEEAQLAGFSLTECANRGEVGTGGFDTLDEAAALSIPALKAIVIDEPAAGQSNKQLYSGFTHDRTTAALQAADRTARMWAVETTDLNILASDYVLTAAESADRGIETDYARVVWLLTTALNTVGAVGSGVVPNSNTVTMEATDYRGRKAADVLAECSEAASKLWFIYDYGAGRKLYYDVATGTSLSSTAYISDLAGDPNGSTVWGVQSVRVKRSPDRIYSKIHLTYNGGTVTVSNGATATAYRQREAHVQDTSISDSTLATAKANALLAGSDAEIVDVEGLTLFLPDANVNDIRHGQRVQIKLTRHGIAAYTYYRVIRRTIQPLNGPDNYYSVVLGLASDVLASANGSRDVWPQKSNANDDGATVIVDRGGITVTGGAITVTNAGAIVIIDGTSDMFRIAASGTQSVSNTTTSTTLTALGALSAAPVTMFMHAFNSSASSSNQFTGFAYRTAATPYAASTSGGSPTTRILGIQSAARGYTGLNGSSQAVVTLNASDPLTGDTAYQYYYVLEQTGF